MNSDKISYIYQPYFPRSDTRGQQGVITIVSSTIPSGYGYYSCMYGASYCAPGDNFCKRTGIELAKSRMFADGSLNLIIVPEDRYNYFSIQLMILSHLFYSEKVPLWAQRYIAVRIREIMEHRFEPGVIFTL
jgi:hypothetical protein